MKQQWVNAVILSGGEGEEWMHAPCKGLISLKGRPMVAYVIAALKASGVVGRIVVVGPSEAMQHALHDDTVEYVNAGDNLMDNLDMGLAGFSPDELVLVATADTPLLTGEAVRDLVTRGLQSGKDGVYSFTEKADIEATFPGARRTYIKLKTGRYTGSNLMMLRPRVLPQAREIFRQMSDNRKNPLALGRMFGLRRLIKLLFGRMSIEELVCAGQKMLGFEVFPLETRYACCGQDIDREEDLAFMKPYIEKYLG
nr:NTP transferase domain-containing protein [bacterium]